MGQEHVVKFVWQGSIQLKTVFRIQNSGFLICSGFVVAYLIAKCSQGFFCDRFGPSGVDSVVEPIVQGISFLLGGVDQIQARADLEAFFGKKVFLEQFVKVEPDWRAKADKLRSFGYSPD